VVATAIRGKEIRMKAILREFTGEQEIMPAEVARLKKNCNVMGRAMLQGGFGCVGGHSRRREA
jgi:hypothetical protein